jgi:hypothetical protein
MAIVAAREDGAAASAVADLAVAEEVAVAEAVEEVDGDNCSVWRSRCVYDDSQKARLTTAFLRIFTQPIYAAVLVQHKTILEATLGH